MALSKAAVNAGSTIHCYVEYDIGMDRCGVVNQDDVVALAREIKALDGLTFDGIQAYAGHISHVVGKEERLDMTSDNSAKLRQLLAKLEEAGLRPHHIEGKTTGWIALDYESVIVHVFSRNDREFYGLDKITIKKKAKEENNENAN